ncbi:uncharacterized protein LOC114127463 [Aphis gossypii]|uniref:uncharacterized protein LOC114127463 n=1 Tax=Aphis gossypii TaxID=80765 RepID=UPI00215988FD|nr:uncharacterized protein LOC114127463 [Aphis gossypii]XP_050058577.1 uncharacterized protein LOC114127463 [Aphis gossypii]XP_050058578.1 uncharacterized protein LOC114127463 [Aphis gossypii]XP_050058579.1 uncharacterized protein LOC114127463 [Aphis gossypii]XP_050058580.1 uncharacterized protein LOC114127463 [Aphis gossypii]XP_050058581.1 uncharacterized protein LOC114127463 [Aphis gossypii]
MTYWLIFMLSIWPVAVSSEGCKFPTRWEGVWFQSGIRQSIVVQANRFSIKGKCVDSDGDKFLLSDEKKQCYRCVVIHEKHHNVLQYKETFCNEMGTIKTICQLITGDALLYSMFRESGNPMQCPFKPPYTFTYNRGHGDCKNPVSTVEACTQDSRLLFRYQACPDVEGSESALEEVECIAGWKEGSYRFLVGRVHHSNGIPMSTEDRFKCFIYERTTSQRQLKGSSTSGDVEYRVAQSGDATCSGLFSPLEGSRTMILKKEIFETKCSFPLWLTENQKWRTLDHGKTFTFPHHHNNNTLKLVSSSLDHVFAAQTIQASHQFFYNQPLVAPLPGHEMKFSCQQEMEELPHRFRVMAHYVTGCQSGYICLDFHRRAHDLAELQMGQPSRRPEDACNSANFDAHATDSITLVAYKSDFRNCPYKGIYTIKKISKSMLWNDASSTLPSKTNLNLPVDLLTSDNHPSIVLTTTSPPSPKRHSSEHYEKSSDDWSVTYKKLQPDLPSLVRSRKNISKEFERLSEYDDDDESILRRVKRKGRRILSSKTITDEECKLNLTSIVFSCGSTDSIELVAECPRSTHIRSAYKCHGSWKDNGTMYQIISSNLLSAAGWKKLYCLAYVKWPPDRLQVFVYADNCNPNNNRTAATGSDEGLVLSFNISLSPSGEKPCNEVNKSTVVEATLTVIVVAIGLLFLRQQSIDR